METVHIMTVYVTLYLKLKSEVSFSMIFHQKNLLRLKSISKKTFQI